MKEIFVIFADKEIYEFREIEIFKGPLVIIAEAFCQQPFVTKFIKSIFLSLLPIILLG